MMRMFTPRASRVSLRVPIRYRAGNNDQWFESDVVNVSESGVLFGPTDLLEGMRVEMILSIPQAIGRLPPGQLFCVGEVVRLTETGDAGAQFHDTRFLLEA